MRQLAGVRHQREELLSSHVIWREHARAVARMHTGLLDMLHHATDMDIGTIAYRVHIELVGVLQKPVDEHGVFRGYIHCRASCTLKPTPRRNRSPSLCRQGRRRAGPAPESRSAAQSPAPLPGLSRFHRVDRESWSSSIQCAKALAILGKVDSFGRCAKDLMSVLFQRFG